MLKYIAMFRATDISTLGGDVYSAKGAITLLHKSPVLGSEEQAKQWIEETNKAFSKSCYTKYHCIISFEASEEENVETVLCDFTRIERLY